MSRYFSGVVMMNYIPESHAAPLAAHNQRAPVHIESDMGARTFDNCSCKLAYTASTETDANRPSTPAGRVDRTGALPSPIQSAFYDGMVTAPCWYNCSQLSRTLEY